MAMVTDGKVGFGPVKVQDKVSKQGTGFTMDDFATTMAAVAPVTTTTVALKAGSDSASVTQAAITGVAGAAQSFGYNKNYGLMSVTGDPIGSLPLPGGIGGVGGIPTTPGTVPVGGTDLSFQPSQSFLEANTLIQTMQDSNMKMLVLQSQVQDINREFTVWSNVLQTKHQTEKTAIQNLRVG